MTKRKRTILWGLVFILLFMVTACGSKNQNNNQEDINSMVREPQLLDYPAEGVWQVTDIVKLSTESENEAECDVGDRLYIAPNLVAMKNNVTSHPHFSSKYVNLNSYLESRYLNPDEFPFDREENGQIFMVRDSDIFALDLIQLGDGSMCIIQEDWAYRFARKANKVSEEVVKRYQDYVADQGKNHSINQDVHLAAMFGISGERVKFSGEKVPYYQTYLIYEHPNLSRPLVYRAEGLFLVDKDGKANILSYKPNEFTYVPLNQSKKSKGFVLEDDLDRKITYADSRIVSFRKKSGYEEEEALPNYEIRFLDKISAESPVSMENFGTPEEYQAFRSQIKDALARTQFGFKIDPKKIKIDDTNIGIRRTNVGWSFVTTMNVKHEEDLYPVPIDLDIIPKVKFFEDADSQIQWTKITNKIPLALTADSSPKKDRVFIQTSDEMHYYALEREDLGSDPILSIQLDESSQVVFFNYFYDESAFDVREEFLKARLSQPQVLFPPEGDTD